MGDLGGDVPVGIADEILADESGEIDLAGLGQLEDCRRGEHLVHRPDAEPRPEGVRDSPFAIRQPVGAAEEHLAVLLDQYGAAEPVGSGGLMQHLPDPGDGLVFGQAYGRLHCPDLLLAGTGTRFTPCAHALNLAQSGLMLLGRDYPVRAGQVRLSTWCTSPQETPSAAWCWRDGVLVMSRRCSRGCGLSQRTRELPVEGQGASVFGAGGGQPLIEPDGLASVSLRFE